MKTKRLARGFLALCIAFVSLVSSVPVSLAAGLDTGEVIQEVTSSDGFEVADGVTYEEAMFTTSDGRTVAGFMIDTNYGAEGSDLKFGVGTPYDGEEYGMQPVSQQLRYAAMGGRNVLAGVNADFYNMSTGEPEGLLVKDGKEIHAWYPSQEISSRLPYRTFFGILEDGTAVIGYKDDYDRCKDQLVQAVGGDIVMVENGEVIDFSASGIPDNPYTSYPRMCVGIREDGSVFFIAVDGKRPDTYSAGLNLVEMARLMVENGAETAMNLDGGGSVTMVVKDPDTEDYTLMNSPSDNTSGPTGGTERSIANCLYLYNDDVPSLPQVTLEKDEDGYYLIRGIEDFEQMNYNPGANFRLADDIDGAGTPIEPVSTFAGTLDGAGHTVNNLTFADPGAAGLIEMLGSRGVVEDLTITNAVISSTSSNVGILVGECAGSVRNVNVSGTVTGGNYVGGLIGTISGSRVTVENCHVNADVTASESYVGILAGQINQNTAGEISRCSAQGTADGSRGVGGFVGYIVDSGSMWIRDCMVTDAFVHGENEHVGGMFGMSKCGVERCFVKDVTVQQDAPNSGTKFCASLLTGWHNFGSLSINNNVLYSGSVTAANNTNSHRLAEGNGTRSDNYVGENVTVNGDNRKGGDEYYEGKTASEEELTSQAFYEELGFAFGAGNPWTWDEAGKAPVLQDSTFDIPETGVLLPADEDGYYLIDSADDFEEIAKKPDAKYRLTKDLAVTEGEIQPVAAFSGEFDGQDYVINGYTSSHPLFMKLEPGAVLKNLSIVNAEVTSSDECAAIAVGVCDGATISCVKVQGSVENTGTSEAGTAGVVGQLASSQGQYLVENCSAAVDVTAPGNAGGSVGTVFGQSVSAAKGEIRACYGEGTVTGYSFVGGFGGRIMDSSNVWVRDCMTKATVNGGMHVGGFLGMAKGGVERCIVADVQITQKNDTANPDANKKSASFLTGWHNYSGLKLENNVIYGGTITTTNADQSFNIANGSGTQSQNYVSNALTINGSFKQTGRQERDGITATEEQLTSQEFYEELGFDFSDTGDWEWDEKIPVLKGMDITVPDRVLRTENEVLNIGSDQTQRTLTWYTDVSGDLTVQYAPSAFLTDGVMPEDAAVCEASGSESSISGKYVYHAPLTDLKENTEYSYRMGSSEAGWSDIYTFNTGSFGDFSFLAAGDPQIGSSGNVENDKNGWENTLEKAGENFPDASFLLSLGDQVEHGANETEYAGYLSTGTFRSLALAAITGNHDGGNVNFKEHFSVPNPAVNAGDTAAGGDYWFMYNNMLVMCLNSNNTSTAQHKAFLEQTLAEQGDKADWKVVTFHHSIFSTASHAFDGDIQQRRSELAPLFSELGIDVVLMGHDHVYTRSYMMNGTTPVDTEAGVKDSVINPDEGQVLYVTANSASGSKYYEIKDAEFNFAAVKNQENTPNISKVDVTEDSFRITTYRTTDMSVVDEFTIYRKDAVSVTGVTLDRKELTLEEGGTAELTATVTPEDADNKNVTWMSSDSDVASVENGVVTAKKAGTATITVMTEDGNFTAECTVTVTAAQVPATPVTGVTLDRKELTLEEGGTAEITATVTPEDADNKNVTWMSSDSDVASVENGVVTAKKAGTATITVMTEDGNFTAECMVTVTASEDPDGTDRPGDTDKPEDTDKPGDTDKSDAADNIAVPQTGDSLQFTAVFLPAAGVVGSLLAVLVFIRKSRKMR